MCIKKRGKGNNRKDFFLGFYVAGDGSITT